MLTKTSLLAAYRSNLAMYGWAAEPEKLTEQVKVVSTWRAGSRIDLDTFLAGVEAMDPTEHQHLAAQAAVHQCCAHSPKGHEH